MKKPNKHGEERKQLSPWPGYFGPKLTDFGTFLDRFGPNLIDDSQAHKQSKYVNGLTREHLIETKKLRKEVLALKQKLIVGGFI